jgi:hypothetical protein
MISRTSRALSRRLYASSHHRFHSSTPPGWMGTLRSRSEQLWGRIKSSNATAIANTTQRVKESVSQTSSKIASQASTAARDAATKTADMASQKAASSFRAGKQVLSETSAASAEYAKSVTRGATQMAQTTGERVSASVQQATTSLVSTARETRNSFFGWALAAVAVYGVATTLTREVFRYAVSPPADKDGAAQTKPTSNSEETKVLAALPWWPSKDDTKEKILSWWPSKDDNKENRWWQR